MQPKYSKPNMEISTISFEKIPLVTKDNPDANEVKVVKYGEVFKTEKDGSKQFKYESRTISTNTGPDILSMLDDLKQEVIPKVRKSRKHEKVYKS